MPAASAAARAPVREKGGGKHEKSGFRVQVAGLTGIHRSGVRGQDVRPPRHPGVEAVRMRLVPPAVGQPRALARRTGRRAVTWAFVATRLHGSEDSPIRGRLGTRMSRE